MGSSIVHSVAVSCTGRCELWRGTFPIILNEEEIHVTCRTEVSDGTQPVEQHDSLNVGAAIELYPLRGFVLRAQDSGAAVRPQLPGRP